MAKLVELVRLDVRKQGSAERLQKALTKTKWLKKYESNPSAIDTDLLEKLYRKVTKKYPGHIGYIMNENERQSWALMVKDSDNGKWIYTVYAISLWEGLAKVLLVLYGHHIKGIKFKSEEGT